MEDIILDGKKRKRLKTRKNLDELRRKSRRQDERTTKNIKSRDGELTYKPNKLITSQRLTLAMFRKTVQSKTILRSEFSEKINNMIQSKKISLNNAPNNSAILNENNDSINSPPLLSLETKNNSENRNNKSPASFLSQESLKRDTIMVSPSIVNTVGEDYLLKCDYDSGKKAEAQEILKYISENKIPDVEDVMLCNKLGLYPMFGSTYHLEEDDTLNNQDDATSSSEVADEHRDIIGSPADIRVSQRLVDTESLSDVSPDVFKKEIETIVEDTPEYIYYPHKLNQ